MELKKITEEILNKIKELDVARVVLKERANNKSTSIAQYDCALAKTIIKLGNGVPFEFEGVTVENPKVTVIRDIAKGICYKEKLEMEKAEALYKNVIVTMEAIKAALSGLQSINRYQEEI